MSKMITTMRARGSARVMIAFLSAVLLHSFVHPASATWSIIIVDTESKEIAVGAATCVQGLDLRQLLPVVLVDVGAGVAQSFPDTVGTNRRRIWDELLGGTEPEDILAILEANDPQHQTRQYGIANTIGDTVTFTGSGAGPFADGIVGSIGTLSYAIQGNVITGAPVIEMARQAIHNVGGDLPEKLMMAMEAARSMGGDGRCSCAPSDPSGCGSPPALFEKSAHVGFMIVARSGDTNGGCDVTDGCASGDYYLNLNVALQNDSDPDPVVQLQVMFDAWRANLVGRPDAVHSVATVEPPAISVHGPGSATMTIAVRDWQDTSVEGAGLNVTVEHADNSDHIASIGAPVDLGGGVFEALLTGNPGGCVDRFRVTVDDSVRPVVLIPSPTLAIDTEAPVIDCADLTVECDGSGNTADLNAWLASATATDNCGVMDLTNNFTGLSDGCGATGSAALTWTATDAAGNTSTCEATFTSEDTTPPAIASNAPPTIVPSDAPISFRATATDVCCDDLEVEITEFDCFLFNPSGKRVDKTKSCVVEIDGDTIHILDSGGVGDHIRWTVHAIDCCGNMAENEYEVVVRHPRR